MASRRSAFNGNTSLIATFSSFWLISKKIRASVTKHKMYIIAKIVLEFLTKKKLCQRCRRGDFRSENAHQHPQSCKRILTQRRHSVVARLAPTKLQIACCYSVRSRWEKCLFYLHDSFREHRSRNESVRARTHRLAEPREYALIVCPLLCYSYWTDNNKLIYRRVDICTGMVLGGRSSRSRGTPAVLPRDVTAPAPMQNSTVEIARVVAHELQCVS